MKNLQNKIQRVQWTYVSLPKTPQNVQISVSSHIRSIFEGAYKPNSRILGIFGMCFDGLLSGCLHWIFQWSHLKMKQLCTCISEGWVLKREAKNICINLVHTLCEPDVWHNIHFFLFRFDEWERLLRSLNIHIFAFPISLSVGEVSSSSAQSGNSAAIIVSKSGTCTDTDIS